MSPFSLIRAGDTPLLLTCEHASNHLPAPLTAAPGDGDWLETHWGWDIGAADVTLALAEALGATAVLGGVSRLVCDLNRAEDDPTLILGEVEGRALGFNRAVDAAERGRRLEHIYRPFHAAVDRELGRLAPRGPLLLSVHSFTPVYLGARREMTLGVLFDDHEPLARRWAGELAGALAGDRVALNAPYSGREGLIYSPCTHGRRHGARYLELEIRQDQIATPGQALALAGRVAPTVAALLRATPTA